MAQTVLTKQVCDTMNAGALLSLAVADGANGNSVILDSEYYHVLVINTDSNAHMITLARPTPCNLGTVHPVGPITVPAAASGKPGVWESSCLPSGWFKDTNGNLTMSFDSTPTGVYVAIVDMTPQPSAV